MIVVIPSYRGIDLSYLGGLIESGARFIVVDDSDGSITIHHPRFKVYNWRDRRRILGPLDERFPRRNGACRTFGFLLAWRESDPGEAIVALDDDCRVYRDDFAAAVERSLSDEARPVASVAGDHLNIFDLYRDPTGLFPRGFPYSARLGYQPAAIGGEDRRRVLFSLGLWKGVADINAVDKVACRNYKLPDAELRHPSVTIAAAKLVSVCSMNMQFRREVIPAVYQLPMHVEVIPGGVIDRYRDIWGGFILKTLMDIRNDPLAVGEPMIEHLKDGDYLRNIWQENLCHQINDEFLRLLAEASAGIRQASYLEMTDEFCARAERCSPLLRQYLGHLTPALLAWTTALR
jgi:hypothetical protein